MYLHVYAVVVEKIKDLSFFFSFKRVKGRDSKQDGLDGWLRKERMGG